MVNSPGNIIIGFRLWRSWKAPPFLKGKTMTEFNPQAAFAEEEKILRRIPRETIIVSLVFSLIGLIAFDIVTALLVLAGGTVSAISFRWLQFSISKFLGGGKKQALKSAILFYLLRLLLILGIFFIIILFFSRKIIAFGAGFSAIVLALLVEGLAAIFKSMKWKN